MNMPKLISSGVAPENTAVCIGPGGDAYVTLKDIACVCRGNEIVQEKVSQLIAGFNDEAEAAFLSYLAKAKVSVLIRIRDRCNEALGEE